jgi:hypothetical protein
MEDFHCTVALLDGDLKCLNGTIPLLSRQIPL